jgi:two-component system LytT family response regulator
MESKRVRTVVVEDEAPAREKLIQLLADQPDFEVVGEFSSGDEAAEGIAALQPDLVFLDVQIPGLDGFEMLQRVGSSKPPQLVFVTAHDKYAIRAFEVNALDYLVKPFDRERLAETLARVRNRGLGDLERKMDVLLSRLETGASPLRRLVVRDRDRVLFVDTDEVRYLEGADNYVRVHVFGREHLIRDTLSRLERQLDTHRFARIHKRSIVNLRFVEEMKMGALGGYLVVLDDGTSLPVGRRYRDRLLLRTRVS